jgi:DNA repair exonuclease SbcCD ATPase subunit
MRVISCHLENFASYKSVEFTFENQGLCLIQGATGAGKSTLCDAIPWVLFGRTAKDGAVDEVISWNAEGPTIGYILLEINDAIITICRTRGNKANDLFFTTEGQGSGQRGKDLNDTQKMINNLLGFDSALYLSGAYFHEFSPTAQFFSTTAKNRRGLCEQLTDLSLAKKLQLNANDSKKLILKDVDKTERNISELKGKLDYINRTSELKAKEMHFEADREAAKARLNFELAQLKRDLLPSSHFINQLHEIEAAETQLDTTICSECGSKKHSDKHAELAALKGEVRQAERENQYLKSRIDNLVRDLDTLAKTKNTYTEMLRKIEADAETVLNQLKLLETYLKSLKEAALDYELLEDIAINYRAVSITNAINSLESRTNQLLSDYFDAEIKVDFTVADADKLDVLIFKDGNSCSYTQLSKGQRQLLKLCFGISVMRAVQNQAGVSFNTIMIDEATDGMDDQMKAKTFRLLQELALEHESVFLVEHSEGLKSLFEKKYQVNLVNGWSEIEQV